MYYNNPSAKLVNYKIQKRMEKTEEEKSQAKPSFFSKALKWTKELAADITEELEKARMKETTE